jgi:hypothetical protein
MPQPTLKFTLQGFQIQNVQDDANSFLTFIPYQSVLAVKTVPYGFVEIITKEGQYQFQDLENNPDSGWDLWINDQQYSQAWKWYVIFVEFITTSS